MRRRAYGAVCVALLILPATAAAEVRRGVDPDRGVRFTLDSRTLTVKPLTRSARRAVYGARIDAICVTAWRPGRGTKVRAVRDWPEGRRRVRFTFRRDVSSEVKWCLIEDGGADVAAVDFVRRPG